MSKRVAYPIGIISFFVMINILLRLMDYGLSNEGVSQLTIHHIFNVADILFMLYVPAILLYEQRDLKVVKHYFYLYVGYSVYSTVFNVIALNGILSSDGLVWSTPLYFILLGIIYIGFIEDRDNNRIYRMGRSIMASGIVHMVYLFVIPTNIERLMFTYDQMSLNPMTFIIIIMQMLLLDDILLDKKQKLDESRVTL